MLGVLLESRSRRSRRSGGVALSVVTHIAFIGAATAATAHGPPRSSDKPETVVVRFVPPPAPASPQRSPNSAAPARQAPSRVLDNLLIVRHIDVPTSVPTALPEITMPTSTPADSILLGSTGAAANDGPRASGLLDGGNPESSNEWRGTEVLMHILTSGKPRYPEALRQASVNGRVLIRFTVDTVGRVDLASVRVVSSTHTLFTNAVRAVLPAFRFKPAEVNGRRVPALAEMPFEFEISK